MILYSTKMNKIETMSSALIKWARKLLGKTNEVAPVVVIDIGCRWGFAELFLEGENRGKFQIYGFDPDEEECARLREAYADVPKGLVNCVPTALAGQCGTRDLYVTKQPACSSLYPPIQELAKRYPDLECIQLEKVIPIEVTTLKKWANDNDVSQIDYIKIDTQGSELEILKAGEELLKAVRCVDIEVEFNPIYEGQALFFEVDGYLRSLGFQLWRLPHLVHYSQDGVSPSLNAVNTISFDSNRQDTEVRGGQLFWADARYVHLSVLTGRDGDPLRLYRDVTLFSALGMLDVLAAIQGANVEDTVTAQGTI